MSRARSVGFLTLAALAVVCAAGRTPVHAASTCNTFIAFDYPTAANFTVPGETVRVQLTVGSGSIIGGTQVQMNRIRFDLDCNSGNPLALGCTDEGAIVEYGGDAFIQTNCTGLSGPVSFSTGHGESTAPNQVVFTPSEPVFIPASTPNFCTIEFDVTVLARSGDPTPDDIEQVAGFDVDQGDAACDNGLQSSGSQSGSLVLCPDCDDDNDCTADSCNQDTGECVNDVAVVCNDNNACTQDRCVPSTGACEYTDTVTPTCSTSDVCAPQVCDPATGTCVDDDAPLSTPCEADGDECTIDHCDGEGNCVFLEDSDDPQCQPSECGENASGPCVVTVDDPPGTFDSLQDAVDSAKDGATIHVEGVCVENVLIEKRHDLTIEGVPPTAEGCPPEGLTTDDLTSTVKGAGSEDLKDVIKVLSSTNIVIRFLNIVDGKPSHTGLEVRKGSGSIAHCNCVTRNKNGIECDACKDTEISKNLIFKNTMDGIWLHRCAFETQVVMNTSRENDDDGIEVDDSCTDHNLITMNLVTRNKRDGIELIDSDFNTITANEVTFNGQSKSKDSGIELKKGSGDHGADDNFVDSNDIHDNSDMLVNLLNCKQTGDDNTGNNVPEKCK